MPNTAKSNLLNKIYLFKDLSPEELDQVASAAKLESLIPGDDIFSEGAEAHSLYVIKFGSVKIQHSAKTETIDVITLGTGSHFGEMAFVDGEPRSASATVLEPTELVRIEYQDLHKVLDSSPAIAVKVYRSIALYLCGRLRSTTTDFSFAREKNLR